MRSRTRLFGSLACLAFGAALVLPAAPAAASPAGAPTSDGPVRPSLAKPTGPYAVGKSDLQMVDSDRRDPWVKSEKRRLMTTVWFPARRGGGRPASYVGPKMAAELDRTMTPNLGLKSGQLDWEHIRTHARTGVPVLGRSGGRPVVLYAPGGLESRAYGSGAAMDLASRGYIVVTVDHTYESPVEFPGGLKPQKAKPGQTGPTFVKKIDKIRVRDVRFVLDELAVLKSGRDPDTGRRPPPRGLARAMDTSSIGMFGHSAGGDTAAQAMYSDRRIDAAIDMDGFLGYDSYGKHLMPVAKHGLDRPFLLMGSQSTAAQPAPGEKPDWRLRTHRSAPAWKSLWQHSTGWKLDLGIPRGKHHVFTDHLAVLPQLRRFGVPKKTVADLIGTNPHPARVLNSERAYLGAFFDQHLRHRPRHLLDGPSPRHPDVRFIR